MSGTQVNTIANILLDTPPVRAEQEVIASIQNPNKPALTAMLMVVSDVVALSPILSLSYFYRADFGGHGLQALRFVAVLAFFLILYCICGMYPGISASPVDEIKRVSVANASAFALLTLALLLSGAPLRLVLICLAVCFSASFAVVIVRNTVRRFGSRFRWWGYPVALLGGGEAAVSMLRKLKKEPYLGLRPIVLVSDSMPGAQMEDVAVCQFRHLRRISSMRVRHAVVAAPELSEPQFAEVLEQSGNAFPNLIIIPDTHLVWKTGAYTRDVIGGVLGLQVRNNLLCPESRLAKRVIDLLICAALMPFLFPLMLVISLAIFLESGGPIFYSQERLGHAGRVFYIWKFRTMVKNASAVLEETLRKEPALRKEWEENQKLRDDPRITRVGRLLRKTSLDELPQLWNVIKGDMSLVGPRPIVREEVSKYKEAYDIYRRTTPGLTGLWQVSGRNRTTYDERVAYDSYYVRNWSVWLDIYLLARTFSVVLTGYGAY
jgi:Undecaprenyl-phosphate galactose phosphotransferase WbaP